MRLEISYNDILKLITTVTATVATGYRLSSSMNTLPSDLSLNWRMNVPLLCTFLHNLTS
jgi:hypothetical protein